MTDEIHPHEPAHPPVRSEGFEFNHPTVISLLYLASFVTGLTAIVGVILTYVWRGEADEASWTASHYAYLIRTFWIGLIGTVAGVILTMVLIGVFLLLATALLVIVRSVMSLLAAQKREPMPHPDSWMI
jgi:uncharacterized membrane protein